MAGLRSATPQLVEATRRTASAPPLSHDGPAPASPSKAKAPRLTSAFRLFTTRQLIVLRFAGIGGLAADVLFHAARDGNIMGFLTDGLAFQGAWGSFLASFALASHILFVTAFLALIILPSKIESLKQEKLKAELQQKEVLLKEVHHRVKNNLQVISSLISLQSRNAPGQTSAILNDVQSRVRAMALIHEKLYESGDEAGGGRIDFSQYLQDLLNQLRRSFATQKSEVRVNLDAEVVHLSIEKAVPCGLIVNELVTNAMKYAYPTSKGGPVSVSLHTDGADGLTVEVADEGVGMPEGVDVATSRSFGLQLVRTLVRQLDGTMSIGAGPGTKVSIRFSRTAA
ncbi:MAG: sensor histidine kinase [Chloroflexi bacterium]|nr:sensor histidine kinase [Chloroflexota bacterium]